MSGRHSLQAEYTKHNERDANTNTETNMPVRIRSFVVCSRARPTTRARHTESELSRKIEIVGWKRERKEKIGASTRARTKKYSRCVRAYVRASCVRAWCVRACVRTCVRACVRASYVRVVYVLCVRIVFVYVRVEKRSCTQHPIRLYLVAIEDTRLSCALSLFSFPLDASVSVPAFVNVYRSSTDPNRCSSFRSRTLTNKHTYRL